jgi:hypothetical protein
LEYVGLEGALHVGKVDLLKVFAHAELSCLATLPKGMEGTLTFASMHC